PRQQKRFHFKYAGVLPNLARSQTCCARERAHTAKHIPGVCPASGASSPVPPPGGSVAAAVPTQRDATGTKQERNIQHRTSNIQLPTGIATDRLKAELQTSG